VLAFKQGRQKRQVGRKTLILASLVSTRGDWTAWKQDKENVMPTSKRSGSNGNSDKGGKSSSGRGSAKSASSKSGSGKSGGGKQAGGRGSK
jgi:hypothetical protein